MANYRGRNRYATRDRVMITPDQITIAGSVTPQQHKISQCVVAKIPGKFTTVDGLHSWNNFQRAFANHNTESTVEAGLKAHGFILERIIPSRTGKPILEFRVRKQDQLYSLAEAIVKKELANLILDYLIPEDERRHTDVLVLYFDKIHYHELEGKLQRIQRNSDESYEIYRTSRRVNTRDDVPELSPEW